MLKIEIVPKNARFLTVLVNDDSWKELSILIFSRYLKISASSHQELETWFSNSERPLVKNFILRRLARRSYHSQELRKLLYENKVSNSTTEHFISEFTQLGYINDKDWLEAFIRSQKAKKQGPKSIQMKLKAKGIEIESLEMDKESIKESILRLIQTKYRSKNLKDRKESNKILAALIRRGFEYEDIIPILNSIRQLENY